MDCVRSGYIPTGFLRALYHKMNTKRMQGWIDNVNVEKWAPRWAATDEKWLLVEEALDEAGNEFNVTDNFGAMEWMVDKAEEKFEAYNNVV